MLRPLYFPVIAYAQFQRTPKEGAEKEHSNTFHGHIQHLFLLITTVTTVR
jgi:hypothetical protein